MLPHLLEFRRRLLQVFVCFIALFVLFFFCASHLFNYLMWPLLLTLPAKFPLIATNITSPVMTPINLAADLALLCTTPFALWQVWLFTAPGLYQRERQYFRLTLLTSQLLFLVGLLFCFYLVLPTMFQFFIRSVPTGIRLMPDIASTADFITRMLLVFGLCFQIPLVCLLLAKLQLLHVATLKKFRPYVIVAAFTIGMLLTPPDVLSQIMLAVPMCILYELGIMLTVCAVKSR